MTAHAVLGHDRRDVLVPGGARRIVRRGLGAMVGTAREQRDGRKAEQGAHGGDHRATCVAEGSTAMLSPNSEEPTGDRVRARVSALRKIPDPLELSFDLVA